MASDGRSFPIAFLGLFLLAVGLLLGSVQGTSAYLPRLVMLSGATALLWGVFQSWATLRFFLTRMRRVAEPGPTTTWLLLGAILLVLSVGLNLERLRLDFTSRRLNSLSTTSTKVLRGLGRRIDLIAVYRENTPEQAMAVDLLEMYRTGISDVRTRVLDPERKPAEARRLGIDFRGGILVMADSAREVVAEQTEAAVTQAILRVADPTRPLLGILTGHGETGGDRAGLAHLREAIAAGGFQLRMLNLAEMTDVPEEVRALLVIGPRTSLMPGEVQALSRFLDTGGRFGAFLDPGHRSGLEELLQGHGILVDGRRVTDDGPLSRSVGLGPETIAVQDLGEHPTTQGLTAAIVLRGATRVGLDSRPIWGRSAKEILLSAPTARLLGPPEGATGGETAGEGKSASALPLGVTMEWEVPPAAVPAPRAPAAPGQVQEKPYARVVVVGDSDFLRDDSIDLYGNREFALHILGWLEERDFLLRFPFASQAGTPLKIGQSGLKTLFLLFEMILPLCMFALAVLSWARRR